MTRIKPLRIGDETIYIEATEVRDAEEEPTQTQPRERTRVDVGRETKVFESYGISQALSKVDRPVIESGDAAEVKAVDRTICKYTEYVLNAFRQVAGATVDKVTLEFGIEIAGEAGIPYVTKGTAKSNLKIKVECSFPNKDDPSSSA